MRMLLAQRQQVARRCRPCPACCAASLATAAHHPVHQELMSRKRVDGKFLGPGGSSVPEGQELLSGLLDSAFEMSQDIKGRDAQDDVSPSIKPIYDRLSEMKSQLDQLCRSSR
ncbi:MAG: DUF2408 domain-containing protein, partial [Methanosarcinales archaeon]